MLNLTINQIQNISYCEFSFDEDTPGLICIVGKNASGKTTLIRSIATIATSEIFKVQCNRHIFTSNSYIKYKYNDDSFTYTYSPNLQALDCKGKIPPENITKAFSIESTFPHGNRYKSKYTIHPDDDKLLRIQIGTQTYSSPEDLIQFLNTVYSTNRFDDLKQVKVRDQIIYIFIKDDKYIREDYFSTGEYFLINLYRTFNEQEKKIIVIDELDTSLDAEAQTNLVKYLRSFSQKFQKKIIFTSHSLPLMKTLDPTELFYLFYDNDSNKVLIENRSYHYIKSLLFGFTGFDKYILVEDERTREFIEFLLQQDRNQNLFYKYKILPIGTATSVLDLYKRNKRDTFLTDHTNILIILDGDQAKKLQTSNIVCHFLPFSDIEKYIYKVFKDTPKEITTLVNQQLKFTPTQTDNENEQSKKFFKTLLAETHSTSVPFNFIIQKEDCTNLINTILTFLKI